MEDKKKSAPRLFIVYGFGELSETQTATAEDLTKKLLSLANVLGILPPEEKTIYIFCSLYELIKELSQTFKANYTAEEFVKSVLAKKGGFGVQIHSPKRQTVLKLAEKLKAGGSAEEILKDIEKSANNTIRQTEKSLILSNGLKVQVNSSLFNHLTGVHTLRKKEEFKAENKQMAFFTFYSTNEFEQNEEIIINGYDITIYNIICELYRQKAPNEKVTFTTLEIFNRLTFNKTLKRQPNANDLAEITNTINKLMQLTIKVEYEEKGKQKTTRSILLNDITETVEFTPAKRNGKTSELKYFQYTIEGKPFLLELAANRLNYDILPIKVKWQNVKKWNTLKITLLHLLVKEINLVCRNVKTVVWLDSLLNSLFGYSPNTNERRKAIEYTEQILNDLKLNNYIADFKFKSQFRRGRYDKIEISFNENSKCLPISAEVEETPKTFEISTK